MNDLPMVDPESMLHNAELQREEAWAYYVDALYRRDSAEAEKRAEAYEFWTNSARFWLRHVKEARAN